MIKKELGFAKLNQIFFLVLIFCLVAVFISSFDTIFSKSRDIKRRAGIKTIIKALDLYHDEYGFYPESTDDWRGWDLTYDYKNSGSGFLEILRKEGFINKRISDPINDSNYYYRYQKYPAGSFGCEKPFYILQVVNFELLTDKNGQGICNEMDWAKEVPSGYTV